MKKIIHVHIYEGDKYFIGECADLPVVTQGKTLDELYKNIEEAISLHLEEEDLSNLGLDENPSIMASLEIQTKSYAKT